MRAFIIVTVKDDAGTFTYDVEVPTDVPVGKIAADIAEVLNCYRKKANQKQLLPAERYSLQNKRTGKILNSEATFLQEGVWQGDVLLIK